MILLLLAQVVVAVVWFVLGARWMWRRIEVHKMTSSGTFFDWVDELT